MILYPAIDLKDGKCVRLLQGDMDKATIFNNSPAEQAKAFWDAGCEWLHIVDLNGAFEGWPVNGHVVEEILKTCPKMKIQLGGGIRDMKTIEYWLNAGISRIILGTVAAENPDLVREAAREFKGKIAVGIDATEYGYIATRGWAEKTGISDIDLAQRYEGDGVSAIIHTDISRDGVMKGPNAGRSAHIASHVSIPIIASGGVSSLDDLKKLKNLTEISEVYTTPLNGAIVGRAIYDKKIDVAEAINLLRHYKAPC